MAKRVFKIIPENKVGKTRLLYKGPEKNLEKVCASFSKVHSSEVYPSFKSGFDNSVFFYDTSDAFLSALYRYCKNNLPRLESQQQTAHALYFKLGIAGALTLFFLYFIYDLVYFVMYMLNLL